MATERRDWSRLEVEATVSEYFEMLSKEIRGIDYIKTEHRRNLQRLLDSRSEGAIEYKHQNISAVLIELGFPYIDGYKPQGNYQELLLRVVEERLEGARELAALVRQEVERPVDLPTVDDLLRRMVSPPFGTRDENRFVRDRVPPSPRVVNYLLREARNQSLGRAGEEFVLNFERARLLSEGGERLAAQVEHVAATKGDHEGFDVLSFETNGRERLIEVKTTGFGSMTPFFVSRNQVRLSEQERDSYQVYRLYKFREDPHLFRLPGAITASCELDVAEYVARPA